MLIPFLHAVTLYTLPRRALRPVSESHLRNASYLHPELASLQRHPSLPFFPSPRARILPFRDVVLLLADPAGDGMA